ncbi:hypothetical protein ACFPH8_00280 [Bizionia hallyeonensis]|uniref:Uncharacterized protein n=1 Tax=Bizionia hallyeonensis TaxID=1123757 RepID=A0ABW0C216_9FLAO
MCKPENNFNFCTCSNKEVLAESEFVWMLTRFIRNYDSGNMGSIIMPVEDLGEGVTLTNILAFLSANTNPFDFEYYPLERDCVDIRKGMMEYFKVIYKDGNWEEGQNDVFSSKERTIHKGMLKK